MRPILGSFGLGQFRDCIHCLAFEAASNSSVASASLTPETFECMSAPPSCSAVATSPVLYRHQQMSVRILYAARGKRTPS